MSAIKTRIMYFETKSDGVSGDSRIGRVTFSKSGRSVYYRGRRYRVLRGGFKTNYFDIETRQGVWITGSATSGNVVEGNKIGTDVSGTIALGNADNGVA